MLKVVDFGASKQVQVDSKPNSLVGTFYYMSPEVRRPPACATSGQVLTSVASL